MVAMVVTWIWLGNISKTTEPSPMVASHIKLVQALPQLARPLVLMENPSRDTPVSMVQSDNPKVSNKSSQKSSKMVQLKVPSLSTLISSTTNQVFTPQPLPMLLVVTPLRFSDGELKTVLPTGSAPTHGAHHGERKDSSRSNKVNAELKIKSSHVIQPSDELSTNYTQSQTIFE